ncbi:MAG: hypothetical protein K2W97_01155 [Chthoniobacterales bacterium]|nr:hypothetical protein [Chthoniobacterales bacterium]
MINKTFVFASLCFAGFLQYWLWERAHVCSVASVGSMMLISVVSLLYGVLVLSLLRLPREISEQRPIQLLLGFFIFNTLLFIVVGAHLLSVKNGFFLFTGIIFLAAPLVSFYKKSTAPTLRFSEQLPGMACLLLSGIGATLLCCDPLSVPIHENGMIYFPMWGDSFFHARLISLFAQADAFQKVSNVQLSGVPLPFYHYAAYLMPAAVVSFTQVNAYAIFSCFLMPVGVFLLGLAAFTLTSAFWKGWPAVAAIVAVIFLPDAYYQGFQNKFLSYQFHLHVGPASFYGIGCAALAWFFMIQGCRDFLENSTAGANCVVAPVLASSSIRYTLSRCAPEAPGTSSPAASFERSLFKKIILILLSYLFLGVMLFYKAQFFVANAFILLLFPCFFFLQCGKRKHTCRVAAAGSTAVRQPARVSLAGVRELQFLVACCVTLFFAFVVHLSQRYPSVPVIALNGGGMHKYFKILSQWTNSGFLHSFLLENLWLHPLSFPWYHLLAGTTLYFCTLGIWGLGVIVALFFLRRKVDAAVWFFPLWIIINYLVMSMGLPMDSRHLLDPEELVNRPLMWAYFAIAAWTAGGLYFLLCGNQLPKTFLKRVLGAVMLLGSLAAPLFFAHGLQTMPMWNMTLKSNAVPAPMVEAIDFIRNKSSAHDLVQDSENDPLSVITGLAERQGYLVTNNANMEVAKMDPIVAERFEGLQRFKQMTTEGELKTFIQTHLISWYLLRPESKVAWPDSFKNSAIFQSDGYRVYYWTH